MELLEFLLHIKRFPSVELWIDEKERYHALCCPSFEHCEGIKNSLEDALMDLIEQLEGYFSDEEKNDLKKLFQGADVDNLYEGTETECPICGGRIKHPYTGNVTSEQLEEDMSTCLWMEVTDESRSCLGYRPICTADWKKIKKD